MKVIMFKFGLPGLAYTSGIKRELTVRVDDGTPDIKVIEADGLPEVTGYEGPIGAVVKATLVDIDDAGNRSAASTCEFTLKDIYAPATPGPLVPQQTGEKDVMV